MCMLGANHESHEKGQPSVGGGGTFRASQSHAWALHILHITPHTHTLMARAVFLLSKGGGPLTRSRGAIDANSHQNSKKKYLCTHFLACAISVNVVGTNAWYLLHL